GRSTGSHRSDGERGSNLRLGTRNVLVNKGRLCALVRAQHADAVLGADESERLCQRGPSCAVRCRPI
ncbi:hypothetical protein POSPLADRAFT_1160957, partial [Postia placenta MAD-698-R-SB12]